MKPTASSLSAPRAGSGRSAPSSPLSPCTNGGGVRFGEQRADGTGVHRRAQPEQVAHHAGVVGRAVEGRVAGHRRDAHQLGVVGGGDDRHHVVVAGVAVEQDPDGHDVQHRRSHATMAQMAVRGSVAAALTALVVLGGACSGDDDDASEPTDAVVTSASQTTGGRVEHVADHTCAARRRVDRGAVGHCAGDGAADCRGRGDGRAGVGQRGRVLRGVEPVRRLVATARASRRGGRSRAGRVARGDRLDGRAGCVRRRVRGLAGAARERARGRR